MSEYRVCARCIMDTSAPDITFDTAGICNLCRRFEAIVQHHLLPDTERREALARVVAEIKEAGRGRDYDCVVGVSGGVDSTYLVHVVKSLGLRPLAVHMDNGWNSELAVANIEKFLRKLDVDLQTVVLDWDEFRDLQMAFLRSSTSDAEVPTDHAILAVLFRVAAQHNIRFILRGSNIVTEGLHSDSWTYGFYDWRYIRGIHRQFGERRKLRSYPHLGFFDGTYAYYRVFKRIRMVNLLNYVPYDKREAMRVLVEELDWTPYGGKHYESIYTRFFQGYILPRKFNLDKRRGHLSTLIMSGQMTREEALAEVAADPYEGYALDDDRVYVLKKLGLSDEAFNAIMKAPIKTYRDYPNEERWHAALRASWVMGLARKLGLLPIERAAAEPGQ